MQKILKRLLFFLFCFFTGNFCIASTLPNGYTQLEYIELDHAYIDTGIVLNDATVNANLKLHITTSNVAWTEANTSNHLMGCSNTTSTPRQEIMWATGGNVNDSTHTFQTSWFSFWDVSPKNSTRWVGTNASGQSFDLYTKYRLDINGLEASVTNMETNEVIGTHTFTDTPISMTNDIRLNGVKGLRYPYNDSFNIARFYDFEIEGIANMIPAKRNSDGVIGMYDIIRNQFYTKSSSGGTISAGPEIIDTCTYVNILDSQFCLTENQPSGSYLTARYNNNKYYINLSVENDALNPKTITSESNNVLRIKVGNTTYNAHDVSVSE